ncbi:MAG: response regulator receiver modulated serine phosphatase [Candidatus Solibacter sp.]|jgi:sigma-B regulation protein RsbU (phosphoserine phosphatase)|nr:response regulator receiver modulated serine phosphatase [Candidatus Solibacter sp.]
MSGIEHTPRQILVVDDEPDLELLVRQRFRRQIREGEFEFFFSHNGEEALQALDGKPTIDLVLSDINMPVMDGLTLLGKLRERAGVLRAVVVSAYGDMPNIRTAMNRGAIDFLMKPIDFDDLEITIRKTLDHVAETRQSLKAQESLLAIRQELGVAARIQQSILPCKFPPFPERRDFELHASMIPAKEVGGDLFDYFLLDEDHLGLVLGDVSGKGVPAALFMAVSRTLLRATALQKNEPGECLRYVNATLALQNPSHMFVTMFYGILNTRTGELRYAIGGHNPPYVYSADGKVRELPGDKNGMIVGLMDGAEFQTASHRIAPGEGLLVYTDGVTEAMDRAQDFYGEAKLEALLAECGGLPADQLVGRVLGSVEEFAAGEPQSDDITVMAMRYAG